MQAQNIVLILELMLNKNIEPEIHSSDTITLEWWQQLYSKYKQ